MKYLSLLLITFFMSSCCSAKQLTNTSQNDIAQVTSIKNNAKIEDTTVTKTIPPFEEDDSKIIIRQETTPQDMIGLVNSYVLNHTQWNTLLQKYVSDAGNVNYKGFKTDQKALKNYIKFLAENRPTADWTKEEKLAYWINAYNAMTIDLIVQNYPLSSIKDIKDPWDQRLWKLGDKWYNLNEIEHDILRKMDEPRIHFAIVCASFSCPKLQNEAFTAINLEEQLTQAAKEFLADKNRNEISQKSIKISKIFQWFSKDFKQNGSLIDFLNQYSDLQISPKAKKSYKDYNWDLNE
ncbi:DUF547 domain-containing protein [Lacinutrix iliipiscaria]|uniref:DUF547 domain-containing protein n=1 Tax=Lacinutrix iliipiscaria TaxID=1230532 RepID=A0ABW5WP06_9FLAO